MHGDIFCMNLMPAAGPDNIPTQLLKETAQQMAPLLTFIFQASLDQGKLPSDWKSANVTPIHKKEIKTDPSNYRPISLTSVCCKTLEHVVYSSIFSHLENHQILTDNQHGFCTRRSCETQLISAISDFHNVSTIKNILTLSFLILLKRLTKFLTLSSVTDSDYLIMESMVNFYHGSRTTYLIDLNL